MLIVYTLKKTPAAFFLLWCHFTSFITRKKKCKRIKWRKQNQFGQCERSWNRNENMSNSNIIAKEGVFCSSIWTNRIQIERSIHNVSNASFSNSCALWILSKVFRHFIPFFGYCNSNENAHHMIFILHTYISLGPINF